MSIKICFYSSITDANNEELDLLKYYPNTERGHCIYCIEAGEICSEFIARYFSKIEILPALLLQKVIEENYEDGNYEKAVKDMYNGVYKANINAMTKDSQGDFEFKVFKECKIVRERILNKYQEIYNKLEEIINKPKIHIYALLTI